MIMRFLNRWRRDNRGVSAVEFAFIAPILILAYFGVAELCGAMLQQRKANHVASEIGDLISQCQTLNNSDFPNFWAIGNTLMYPLSTSTLSMQLTSITADSTGTKFTVGWTSASTGSTIPAYTKNQAITNSAWIGLIPANGSVVMAQSKDTYTSPVSIVMKNAMTFSSTFYLTPRQVTIIPAPTATATACTT